MRPDATLISFGTGPVYARYLSAMFATAAEHFFPGRAQLLELTTRGGWPYSVRDRHTVVLENRRRIRGRHVLFLDADMLFEGPVGDEIFADGVTACPHPVQDKQPPEQMTYERSPGSAAYIPYGSGSRYYYGACVGGPAAAYLDLAGEIDRMCKADGGYCPVWQDESYLNRIFLDHPPTFELDGRYCTWWNLSVADCRIRTLEKTPEEFEWRNNLGKEAALA